MKDPNQPAPNYERILAAIMMSDGVGRCSALSQGVEFAGMVISVLEDSGLTQREAELFLAALVLTADEGGAAFRETLKRWCDDEHEQRRAEAVPVSPVRGI